MHTTAIILAGGRGSRVGGEDKAWLPYRGKPLIEHLLERLRPQVDDIVISCNRNLPRYRALGCATTTDITPGFAGPLAGIAAAAPLCRGNRILLSPCDTPLLPTTLVQTLAEALADSDLMAAIPRDDHGPQYLNSLLRRDALDSAVEQLASGQASVKGWLASLASALVDFKEPAGAFTNINRPEDFPPA